MSRTTFRKVIVTPELMALVNPENLSLAARFLKVQGPQLADSSVRAYRSDLNIFFVWLLSSADNKHITEVRKIEFKEFFAYGDADLRWSSSRYNRMRSCLSSFCNFIESCFDDQYPNFRNIVLQAVDSMPKVERREKTILTEAQVNGLLDHLSETGQFQEACWLALAVASGSRFSELLRFTTDNIDPENTVFEGIFLETLRPIKTKGRTKAGKLLRKYIIKDIFWPHYTAWLQQRAVLLEGKGKEHTSVFVKADGSPAEAGAVRQWVAKFSEHLGVPVYPHCLRHYIVTYLTRIGLPAELIVEIMGWSSAEMYKIYNDLSARDREWSGLQKLREHLASRGTAG